MADDNDLKVKEKGNKKIIIIAVALVLLLAAGGGAFFFLMGDEDAPVAIDGQAPQEVPTEVAAETAYYTAMPRPFVFNIMGLKRERLVQIKVQLMLRGKDNEKLANANIPLIESTLLQVFSATTEQQLSTFEGKELLRSDSLTSVVEVLTKYTGKGVVEKILFSGFVMQ